MENKNQQDAIMDALNFRYATKRFDTSRKISDSDWKVLSESIRLAPSSYGLQPWKFIVVANAEIRSELRKVSWNQPQVEEASHFIVLATLKNVSEDYVAKFVEKTAEIRKIPTDSLAAYRGMMVQNVVHGKTDHLSWTQRQAYIALGFIGLSAALLEIDSCMMEGFDPKAYDQILGLENGEYASVCAIALGYRSPEDQTAEYAKSRFDPGEVIEVR